MADLQDIDDPVHAGWRKRPSRQIAHLAEWLRATPAELLGLCVLLLGAITLTGLSFWAAATRPGELPGAADQPAAVQLAGPAEASADGDGPVTSAAASDDVSPGAIPSQLTVHVSGAVRRPGLVVIGEGARVADAVGAAGGATAQAQLERLNLARLVVDGEQVHVPKFGEEVPSILTGDDRPVGLSPDGRIDLNVAGAELLETLPGIGPAKAAAIVTHRQEQGPFGVPGDLRGVPGIGERTFQRLADLIAVG